MSHTENQENKETIQKVASETISSLKIEHGQDLRKLTLPANEDETEFIEVMAVVPKRKIIGQYQKYERIDPLKAQEIVVKNCVLTDKEKVLADDGLFYSAFTALTELMPIRQGKSERA
ncbi:hypothetical protein BWK59_08175 [Flavobacterium davisii]|uniref:Uncharacterized protein n=1 Tax=Flavobacterium davisii TaxID=2906077 RepID=A0A246GHX5_9FLAO|nr:hypothetical protein [Flavobacterium davisii]OWP83883.1 hypothetical protein BWK59_08175 [Flavobacterium davisii]